MAHEIKNAFTVDVEDYFQVSAFEKLFPKTRWDDVPLRLERSLDEVLAIADRAAVKGTFYVLGWLAQKRPELIRKIVDAGHELGCHSFDHQLVYEMTPSTFREDLNRALGEIEDASGERCALYRAPSFSITESSLWALEVLADSGIRIDSSIYPVRHDRYGMAGAPRSAYRPLRAYPEFVELPPTTVRMFGMTLPAAGGGYLRLYPLALTRSAIRKVQRSDGQPAVMYVHPWEFDPDQPRVSEAGTLTNFRHRVGLRANARRVEKLLRGFAFTTMSEVVASLGGPQSLPFRELRPAENESSEAFAGA